MKDEAEYYEIQGLYDEDDNVWHPLFQYTSQYQASQILTHLLGLEELPRELEHYEDFRCMTVERDTPESRRRAARAEKGASEGAGNAPERPVEPRKRSEARAVAAQGKSRGQKRREKGEKRRSRRTKI